MKTRISFVALVLGAALGLAFLAGAAQATPVNMFEDNFTTPRGTAWFVDGRTPDTTNYIPGTTWYMCANTSWGNGSGPWSNPPTDGNGYWWREAAGYVYSRANNMVLDVGNPATYSTLHISAVVAPYGSSGSYLDCQGLGIGFFGSQLAKPIAWGSSTNNQRMSFWTGLSLKGNNGDLYLFHNYLGGYNRNELPSQYVYVGPVAFTGSWSASTYRTVSYDIDVATGAISNIYVQGSTSDYSSLQGDKGYKTSAYGWDASWLKYAGLQESGDNGPPNGASYWGRADSFKLTGDVIPEPSTLALLGMGLVGLLCYAWRKRK